MKNDPIGLFDLHCDTIGECHRQNKSLYRNTLQLDLSRGLQFSPWVQTFALWMDDRSRGDEAWQTFQALYQCFMQEYQKNETHMTLYHQDRKVTSGKCTALISLENGTPLGEDLQRIAQIKQMGISMITLVWNGNNQIGSGVQGDHRGLTDFGKQAIAELEYHDIVIDVSHLNDKGFEDVERMSKKPFIASHSNARDVSAHPRNLNNHQIQCLIQRKGLIGMNFYSQFVAGRDQYDLPELIRHMEHILAQGGEHVLALGSDFDGAPMPAALRGIQRLETLHHTMVKYLGQHLTNKIFFENADRFFKQK